MCSGIQFTRERALNTLTQRGAWMLGRFEQGLGLPSPAREASTQTLEGLHLHRLRVCGVRPGRGHGASAGGICACGHAGGTPGTQGQDACRAGVGYQARSEYPEFYLIQSLIQR